MEWMVQHVHPAATHLFGWTGSSKTTYAGYTEIVGWNCMDRSK